MFPIVPTTEMTKPGVSHSFTLHQGRVTEWVTSGLPNVSKTESAGTFITQWCMSLYPFFHFIKRDNASVMLSMESRIFLKLFKGMCPQRDL